MTRPKYGSDIGEARRLLLVEAEILRASYGAGPIADRIEDIVNNLMYRKGCGRKAGTTSRPLSARKVTMITSLLQMTDLSQQEIAQQMKVNPGRVSEIANNLRDPNGQVI